MPTLHLIEGPVGSGKSTYAATLAREHSAPRLILDDWMATLFRPDRPETDVIPWYLERKKRCLAQIWNVARDLIDAGSDVVLELGLIERRDREDFYRLVDDADVALRVVVLDAELDVRRQRVRARNVERGATFAMVVPDDVFDMASRLWEPPDEGEVDRRGLELIDTTHLARPRHSR
ncbi:MAG: ATP-binding protein [Myxococcales bacterium]|nr:ATP-binding protein [Myxococcales bacterium]